MTDSQLHLHALAQCLSTNEIVTDAATMAAFCLDQRRRYQGQVWAVLQPHSVASVQAIMRYCFEHHIPVTPQGGNTGLCGGATPHESVAERGVIVSLSKLNRLRSLNLADDSITVEAGMLLAQVQDAALAAGRFFPLSLASEGSCQIGGNIACNAGGLNVVRYGTTRDLVLGLEVVLPDGTLVSQLQPLHKNTSGYELKQQLVGSEGTLGIITAATLKLFAPLQSICTAWIALDSIQAAVALLAAVKSHFGQRVSSFELMSDYALTLSSHYSQLPVPLTGQWHVLLELSDSMNHIDLSTPLVELLDKQGWYDALVAQSQAEQHKLWTLRENISAAQRHIGASIKHDIALPIAAIADFILAAEHAVRAHFTDANIVVFGHLGDGSLHYNVFLPQVLSNEVYQYEEKINQLVYAQALALGGTIAAEHGIGQLKKHWLAQVRSPAELGWMRANKQALDPHNIMNPGKLLPD